MRLIFVGQDCVKRIGGDAVMDISNGIIVDDTPETVGVPMSRIKLIGGVVTVVPPTQAEIDAAGAKADQDAILKKMFLVAFNHENRIRVLEGKAAITKAQFKTALAGL